VEEEGGERCERGGQVELFAVTFGDIGGLRGGSMSMFGLRRIYSSVGEGGCKPMIGHTLTNKLMLLAITPNITA
jgi:hypothetical protein